jgi:hypothetical protein
MGDSFLIRHPIFIDQTIKGQQLSTHFVALPFLAQKNRDVIISRGYGLQGGK